MSLKQKQSLEGRAFPRVESFAPSPWRNWNQELQSQTGGSPQLLFRFFSPLPSQIPLCMWDTAALLLLLPQMFFGGRGQLSPTLVSQGAWQAELGELAALAP